MKACRSACFVCVRFREKGDHKNTTEHCKARGGLTMSCLAPRRARPYPSSQKSCEALQHPLDPMHFFAQMPTNATENPVGPLPTHGRRCPSVADPRRLIRVSGLSVSDSAAIVPLLNLSVRAGFTALDFRGDFPLPVALPET